MWFSTKKIYCNKRFATAEQLAPLLFVFAEQRMRGRKKKCIFCKFTVVFCMEEPSEKIYTIKCMGIPIAAKKEAA